MKYSPTRRIAHVIQWMLVASAMVCAAAAQQNSWTSPTSGNWQDASWSLGIIPGTNQTILLTNAGWKAVQIGAATAQSFPQSLNVNSIIVSSPTNSFNTLVLNYAGADHPLTVQTLLVASNSSVVMTASGLQIEGSNGEGLAVGGEFDQNDSVVGGNQINVGYIGPGVYNFNGGYLAVSQLWIGRTNGGVVNQSGGTNAFGITYLEDDGAYVLSNGLYGATAYFEGGAFRQYGGLLNTNLGIFMGSYLLAGGILVGGAAMPPTDAYTYPAGAGSMLQTGGTNLGPLSIGETGSGSYVLSNGVSLPPRITVGYGGSYEQWGGVQVITNIFAVTEAQVDNYDFAWGTVNLHGGQLSSAEMDMAGRYSQDGGTNQVAGLFLFGSGTHTALTLSGGLLAVSNMDVMPSWIGGVSFAGGTLVVSNELSVGGNGLADWQGFVSAGHLVVSNIVLGSQSLFYAGGVITQSGVLTMVNANLYAGTNAVRFGALCLGDYGTSDSTLSMPGGPCTVAFGDCSGVTWSNQTGLIVENWNGSLAGGGQQQIIFGAGANALKASQLAQIQFDNPAGLAAGTYPAKILSSGEIVPSSGVPLRPNIALSAQSNGMQVKLQGESGRTYTIETSTDLVHWVAWTNQVASDGTIHVIDTDTTNAPMRFYRAKLVP